MNLIGGTTGTSHPQHGSGTSRRRRAQRHRVAAEARGVHAALAQEAHDVALLVAVTGSIVNAIVSNKRPQLRVSLATYLPSAPSLFQAAVSTAAASAALSTDSIQSLIGYYGLVSFARTATLGYSAKREPGGIAGPVSMETLGEAWQAAATQSIGVLTMLGYLDKASPMFEGGKDNTASLRLIEMLWSVSLGRSPCVRIDGAVIVPGWIERRTHLRREINTPAVLSANGSQQQVIVRDLSAGGIGLEGSESVQAGDTVNVALGTGVTFDGVAVWNRDGRLGIRLTQPLTTSITSVKND